jgi:hypothetical protein
VFQGTTQQVAVETEPPGANVSIGPLTAVGPAKLRLSRRPGYHVVRASKDGYYGACKLVSVSSNPALVVLDSIPAALPYLFDLAVGSLGVWPKSVHLTLEPAAREAMDLLPSDDAIVSTWDTRRADLCKRSNVPLRLYNLKTAEVAHGTFDFGATTTGRVTIPLTTGEVLRGEYSTAPEGTVTWGSIYGAVYARAAFSSNSVPLTLRGQAVVTGDRSTVVECEYVTNNAQDSPQGHGACRDNRGNLYRVMFGGTH